MATLIQLKRGTGAPASLAAGELAVDTATGDVYVGTGAAIKRIGQVMLLPTGGTTGQVLTKASATNYDVGWASPISPAYPTGGEMFHDSSKVLSGVELTHYVPTTSHRYNTATRQNGTYALGDSWSNGCLLAAGTYRLSILCITANDSAQLTITFGGVSVTWGGASFLELYSASTTFNVVRTSDNIVIPTSGRQDLILTVTGKHTSSSGYVARLTKFSVIAV